MSGGKIRVLVVDDSITVRKRLVEVLSADPEIEVIAEADDGKTAIERCVELRPDVVTLDMILPVMSGLAATEYIMAHCPTPILIVSSSVNRGELFHTYDALAAGAVDVLDKANSAEADNWEEQLVATVKLISRVRVITHPRARLRELAQSATRAPRLDAHTSTIPQSSEKASSLSVLAIGASTGGPAAIVQVLSKLPSPFPIPILVVIHISAPFATAFADWLRDQTGHDVFCPRGGEFLASVKGRVALAPADHHLIVRGGRLHLSLEPPRHSCRPSVDVLFESLAVEMGLRTGAALLTGMGRDGAMGLLAIKKSGGFTIAQDEASSVIYGMPREAALLNAAERILPLSSIGPTFAHLVTGAKTTTTTSSSNRPESR